MSTKRGLAGHQQQFSVDLQQALTSDEVHQAFLAHAAALIRSDAFALYRLDPEASAPVGYLSVAEHDFVSSYEKFGRADDPVLDSAMTYQRPVDSSRACGHRRWEASGARAALGEAGLCHSLEAPLIAAGRVVGTVNFARSGTEAVFSKRDLAAARIVSEQLGLAIGRARRHDMTRRRAAVLEAALDRVPHGVIMTGDCGGPDYLNKAARAMLATGVKEADRQNLLSPLAPHFTGAASSFQQGHKVFASGIRSRDQDKLVAKSWTLPGPQEATVTLVSSDSHHQGASMPLLPVLSDREQQITQFISEGLTTKEVAERAFITENTVKQHLKRIFIKTNVRNRAELVQLIWSAGTPARGEDGLES